MLIFQHTASYPNDLRFSLTSQTQRAAMSIGASIAEGCGRGTDKDFARFLSISMGSACELDNHLQVAHDLKLIEQPIWKQLYDHVCEIKRMLASLIRKLKADS